MGCEFGLAAALDDDREGVGVGGCVAAAADAAGRQGGDRGERGRGGDADACAPAGGPGASAKLHYFTPFQDG